MQAAIQARAQNAVGEGVPAPDLFCGEVFTPAELAKALKVSTATVRRMFQDVSGVIKIGDANPRGKRGYQTLRIPRQVAERVLRERSR
jgi:hypothetical protein